MLPTEDHVLSLGLVWMLPAALPCRGALPKKIKYAVSLDYTFRNTFDQEEQPIILSITP